MTDLKGDSNCPDRRGFSALGRRGVTGSEILLDAPAVSPIAALDFDPNVRRAAQRGRNRRILLDVDISELLQSGRDTACRAVAQVDDVRVHVGRARRCLMFKRSRWCGRRDSRSTDEDGRVRNGRSLEGCNEFVGSYFEARAVIALVAPEIRVVQVETAVVRADHDDEMAVNIRLV